MAARSEASRQPSAPGQPAQSEPRDNSSANAETRPVRVSSVVEIALRWIRRTRIEINRSGRLRGNHPDIERIEQNVTAPQPAWLARQAIRPFESDSLQCRRRLRHGAGVE